MQVDEALLPGDNWCVGTVSRRVDWSDGLFTITVEAALAPFVPGQFLNLGAHIGERWIQRSYSLASAPGQPAEFFVVRVPDGTFTPHLQSLQPGDQVGLTRGAHGHFTLELVADAPLLWLVATGTGLAPYIAMLRTDDTWSRFGRVIVVHGVRQASDLAYADELAWMKQAHAGRLTWVPVVSRAPDHEGVLHGRIPANLDAIERAAGAAFSADTSQVLLCGNPEMVGELEHKLGERGLQKNRKRAPGHITTERYW